MGPFLVVVLILVFLEVEFLKLQRIEGDGGDFLRAELRDLLGEHTEVLAWYEVAGRRYLFVHVGARDTAHLQRLVLDAFTARPEVHRVETTLIFDWQRAAALPDLLMDEG